ncbi:MAG: P22 phage major capsid protein family protein [Eubacteriales bacterium]|nr:P22 phage major capsid protein family protein [Eubacteriales bacterium]
MAYESFRPEILAKELMTNRNRDCVFKDLCYKGPILGEITKKGDVLHIAGVGRPTVRDYTPGEDITLENKTSYNQDLYITQAKYVNVEVDRVDGKQAQGEVFNIEIQEAKRALAQTLDEYIAGFHDQAAVSLENASCTSATILSTLAEAEQVLLESEVPFEEEKFLVISPAVYTKLVLGKIMFQQANKEVFGKGFKGSYLNFNVYVSNSIKKTGDVYHCMAFSRQAIALAEQIPASMIERYKPEKTFADAFKVLHLYGGTVIRPGELVKVDLTTADETEI